MQYRYSKMKILQVNNVYKIGSTGKITYDLHKGLLERGIESIVCYGRGENYHEPHVYKVCGELDAKLNNLLSRITGLMYGGSYFSTYHLISIIKKEKPDVVHLQCINGYFVNIFHLIEWLKRNHVKTVLTLHAEFMYTANCGYAFECNRWKIGCGHCPRLKRETKSWFLDRTADSWEMMKRAFDGFHDDLIVTSVSPWLMDRAKQSPILQDKTHKVVLNGLDTEVFHPYNTKDLRKRFPAKKIVFHVTPSFTDDSRHVKGGYYVIQLAKMMANEDVLFLIAGNHSEKLQVPSNCILLGKISDQCKLAQYYSMADITLLTSKKETFSMVTAESLCCGTPVVGFKAGGPEQIAIPEYSSFVEYGDLEALLKSVRSFLLSNMSSTDMWRSATERYSSINMIGEYCRIYRSIIS